MRKRILSILFAGITGISFSQVGVQTENPTETLNVNGELRVNNLPTTGNKNSIYTLPDGTRSATKDQTFKGSKTVVVDDNGVFGTTRSLSNSRCYASTTGNFSEAAAKDIMLYDDGEVQVKFHTNTVTTGGNDLYIKHSYPSPSFQAISKGDNARDLGTGYYDFPPNTWNRVSNNIAWDYEHFGRLLVWTDVDAPTTVNANPMFFKITFYSQKRLSNSYPSVCFNVERYK